MMGHVNMSIFDLSENGSHPAVVVQNGRNMTLLQIHLCTDPLKLLADEREMGWDYEGGAGGNGGSGTGGTCGHGEDFERPEEVHEDAAGWEMGS